MTLEYVRAISLVVAFVLFAILVAKALERPLEPAGRRPFTDFTVVSATVTSTRIDIDDEIEKQRGWQ